ncbi:MAG: hypothetical protein Q8942_03295 [Bacillota bacterium]|nr:hypothetical protein [Bacillota bacterium]
MICPRCKQEYIAGAKCSVCDVRLESKLTEDIETPYFKMDEFDYEFLLATFNALDISLVRSILDTEKINYSVKGQFNYAGREPARVLVRRDQYDFAVDMLKEIRLNYTV